MGCQACGGEALREIEGFAELPRVTSDSKPFRPGGRLFSCERCGLAQKRADERWRAEIAEIYRDYEMYHQSAALDQPVFEDGRAVGRCELIVRRLLDAGVLAPSGKLLDVGAGSGAMLAAVSGACPRWKLFGQDLDARKEPALRAIRGFERLFTVPPAQLGEQFDLVTLVHSLEHFTEPLAMLRSLQTCLKPAGRLLVQVNDVERMPFDLVVADHLCHFTPASLAFLAGQAGFQSRAFDWVRKEISLLCSPDAQPTHARASPAKVEAAVSWLRAMLAHARSRAGEGRFGIFGTSVAATWLAAGLGDAVSFFVDEDPARRGRTHLGRPIVRPEEVSSEAQVYLAFPPETALAIAERLSGLGLRFSAFGQ